MALPAVTNPADAPGLIFRMGVGTLYPLARILTRFDHHGGENLPGPGPALIVSNHISNYDPVVLGSFPCRQRTVAALAGEERAVFSADRRLGGLG